MWKITKLGDVCKIQSGNSIPVKEKEVLYRNVNEGLPYVGTKDVGFDGVIDYENGVRIPPNHSSKFRLSKKNSILVCGEGGSAGRKIAFSNKDCHFVNKLFSISTGSEMVSKYVYYYTLSNYFQNQFKKAMHGLIGGVSLSKIKGFQITYPPFSEQQRIVAKLDATFTEIDKAIATKKFNKEKIKKIENSSLKKLLNGNFSNKKIGDICELVYGKGLSKNKRITEKNGVPVYGANGIKSYTTNPLYQKQSIIVGRKGSAGELQWVDKPFWALDVSYYVVTDDKQIKLKYLYYLLKMQNLPKLAKGVKPGINRNDVYNINIKLPLINEQIKIIENLEKIFEQNSILLRLYKKQITNYLALKSAILAKELKHKAA